MMADMFADKQLQNCINHIIDNKENLGDSLTLWKSLTRQMFHNYPAIDVFHMVHIALEEASDKQWFEKKYPKDFFKEKWVFPKRKSSVIKQNLKKKTIRKLINDNLKIIDVAKNYGIKIKGKKARCPFHNDKEPSLSFSDEKNVFNCFGCGAKGDIITFIQMIERRIQKYGKVL